MGNILAQQLVKGMDSLPFDVVKIIDQYKLDMEMLMQRPDPSHYMCSFRAEERQILTQICTLSFGHLATVLRVRDILEASVDLIDFYRESERIWNCRHQIWGLTPYNTPPGCSDHLGYMVYKWLCLQSDRDGMDGVIASCIVNQFCFW